MKNAIVGKAIVFLASLVLLCALQVLIPEHEANAQSQSIADFSVDAGESRQVNTPVSASLEGVPLLLHEGQLQLFEITDGDEEAVASQLKAGNPPRLAWILEGETQAGSTRNFQLRVIEQRLTSSNPTQKVSVEDDGKSLHVSIGDRSVLNYRYTLQEVPEGVDEIYRRSGYIHPIWSPEGEVLSRIQPPDHYHHYGIWNPWTRTEFEGREVDFWNLASGQGTVRAQQVVERTEGDVFGGFRTLHNHIDFTGEVDEKTALYEQWEVNVWNVDPERDVWLIDFISILNPATDEPLTIKEYRYQGFSLRATEKWNDDNTTLLTSQGYDKSNANATRARWIDVNGVSEADSGTSGILFMTNPANFNYPEQLRIWPVGANDGVENVYINFNPAQDRDWELQPGQSYALRYRMLVYDGSLTTDEAERYWANYAKPPQVEVDITEF